MGVGAPELLVLLFVFGIPLLIVSVIVRSAKASSARRTAQAPASVQTAPAWHPDPTQRHQLRWWDGQRWTEQVVDNGVPRKDAL